MALEFANFTKDEILFSNLYKGNSEFLGREFFANHINGVLCSGKELDGELLTAMMVLDSLIEKGRNTREQFLYRATLDSDVSPYVRGSQLCHPAYMSTSSDPNSVGRHFSTPFRDVVGAYLEIECPPVLPALDLELNKRFSGDESEFLLPRGAKFEIEDVKFTADRKSMADYIPNNYLGSYSGLKIFRIRYSGLA